MLQIDINQTRIAVSQGYGLPSMFYTSQEYLSLERKQIFGSAWQFAVHRDQLKTPNSYAVARLGEFSVIVTKDAEGNIHAFRNVCLHRGAPIAKCSGTGRCFAAHTTRGPTVSTARCARPLGSRIIRE